MPLPNELPARHEGVWEVNARPLPVQRTLDDGKVERLFLSPGSEYPDAWDLPPKVLAAMVGIGDLRFRYYAPDSDAAEAAQRLDMLRLEAVTLEAENAALVHQIGQARALMDALGPFLKHASDLLSSVPEVDFSMFEPVPERPPEEPAKTKRRKR